MYWSSQSRTGGFAVPGLDTGRHDSSDRGGRGPAGHRNRRAFPLFVSTIAIILLMVAGALAVRTHGTIGETLARMTAGFTPSERLVTIPAGTPITVELRTSLSTRSSRPGDRFTALVATPIEVDGRPGIPAGSEVSGRVLLSEQPGKASGRGHMELAFDEVVVDGRAYDLGSRSVTFESRSGTRKDVAMIGGGAAAGGLVGGILGHGASSALKGFVIGSAAGTAASLLTRGPQLEFPAGTRIRFTLDRSVEVREPRPG